MTQSVFNEEEHAEELAKFDLEYIQTLNLPIKVSEKLLNNVRDRYIDFLKDKNTLEKILEFEDSPHPRMAREAISTSGGILAEKLELFDFARKLYKIADQYSYAKHVDVVEGKITLDDFLQETDLKTCNGILPIYHHKKDKTSVRKIQARARKICLEEQKYTHAAIWSKNMQDFDLALQDIQTLFSSNQELTFEHGKDILSLARIAKKAGYSNYARFFDYAIQFYKTQKTGHYQVARAYYESERQEQAIEHFKKAKCFQRALWTTKSVSKKSSRVTAKNLVEQKLIFAELEEITYLESVKDVIDEDPERAIRYLLRKPLQLATRYGVEDHLLNLVQRRAWFNIAYKIAKKTGQNTTNLEHLLTQAREFEIIIEDELGWMAIASNNSFMKYFNSNERQRFYSRFFGRLVDANKEVATKICQDWEKEGANYNFDILKHFNFDANLFHSLIVRKYYQNRTTRTINQQHFDEEITNEETEFITQSAQILLNNGMNEFLTVNLPNRYGIFKPKVKEIQEQAKKRYIQKAKRLGAYRRHHQI